MSKFNQMKALFIFFCYTFLGIYIRNDNEKVRKEFRGIGMRIEDDILLGSNGVVEVLTEDAVRDPESIELLTMTGYVEESNSDPCISQNLSL